MVQIGDVFPAVDQWTMEDDGKVQQVNTQNIFKGKKVVLFAVPGEDTSTR